MLSVGLRSGDLRGDDAMAVDGLRATVQGQADSDEGGAFRGGEALRLRRGALLVVGEGHIVCGACRNCLAGRRHDAKIKQRYFADEKTPPRTVSEHEEVGTSSTLSSFWERLRAWLFG